jgi:hypothetical protein
MEVAAAQAYANRHSVACPPVVTLWGTRTESPASPRATRFSSRVETRRRARGCAVLNRSLKLQLVKIVDVKKSAGASVAKRLAALELQFLEIGRMTKRLRRSLDEVAETVRNAVDELGEARSTKRRGVTVSSEARRPPAATSRRRASQRRP